METNARTPSTKILLIEDHVINIRVATICLNECGVNDIIIARTGRDALRLFSDDIQLVILDIGLPDMSGVEVCRQIREISHGESLPIIAYTAHHDFTEQECERIGVNDFLIKPVSLTVFKTKLQRWLPQQ